MENKLKEGQSIWIDETTTSHDSLTDKCIEEMKEHGFMIYPSGTKEEYDELWKLIETKAKEK